MRLPIAACVLTVLLLGCDRAPGTVGSPNVSSDPPAAPGAIAPSITATATGVAATWVEPVDQTKAAHRIRFARFTDGAWTPATTIAESPAIVANWADTPSVVQQDDGTLVAHWAAKSAPDAYAYDVMLARSVDGGRSWQHLGRAHDDRTATEHGFVSLVPARDHTIAIWLDGRDTATGGPTKLRTSRVTTEARAPADSVIDDRVCDCCSTSAARTEAGTVVVYRDRSADEIRDIAIARHVDGKWTAPALVASDNWKIAGCPVNGPAIAANGRDVVVAWFTLSEGQGRVRVAFSSDSGASFGAPVDVALPQGTRAPAGRVDVELHAGDAIVTWLASDREAGQVLARRVARDGRRGDVLVLARTAAGRESGFPRIAVLRGNELLVTWTDTSEPSRVRALRLAATSIPAVTAVGRTEPASATARVLAVGAHAPDYRALDAKGSAVTLRGLRGGPVLVNVWATWCEPCRHELPILDEIRVRYAPAGLRVIAANVDREEPADQVAGFFARRKLGLELWLDREDRASAVFGVGSLPATLLFDAAGTLVWRRDGAILSADAELEAALQRVTSR